MDEETPLITKHSNSETLTKSLLVDFLSSWCCSELGEYYLNYNVFDKSLNASRAVVLAIALLVSLSLHLETIHSATFTVGDSSGWDFSVGGWTNGKQFKAGDMLSKMKYSVISTYQY
ncbi:hypothetical protein ACSBR2_001517 [Camellia fascicularis]